MKFAALSKVENVHYVEKLIWGDGGEYNLGTPIPPL